MDEVRNPFAPGAGSQPPELAGRDEIIRAAEVAIKRVLAGKHGRSQMFLGLRGVGKTVLLNKIEEIASDNDHLTSFVESPEDNSFAELIYPKIHQALRKLSFVEGARAKALDAMRALRSFASTFKIEMGDMAISVDAEPGVADSGNLEYDLSELFEAVGLAAKAAGRAWTLLIDEVQYLREGELSALIVAIHRSNQKNLPIIVFGAGLPQLAALTGDAKSYAERLFEFPEVGPLHPEEALKAIKNPILEEGEEIDEAALDEIISKTEGYPYFLQEWGFQSWNTADASPISLGDVRVASERSLSRLDEGFFKVRFDRLTPKEREYVVAMAALGEGPYRSSDVADRLGEPVNKLGPRRASIIKKGMIYSPEYGDLAFTVPMFADYLNRTVIGADLNAQ
ncbi:ATP-binding protein [Pseudooceanicola nitratireducens]|uniref:AAA family ATPase n=1 Tax=Pseudooceanicola nitratireducens TaxID=517719 RepID=UPI001C9505B1|nr:ATP-binding protein [Pseudooceanicola nitratireducens]MEC7792911.1 ATP-binding protein [Pseudomonadota bacterium]